MKKRLLALFAAILCLALALPALAEADAPAQTDAAGLEALLANVPLSVVSTSYVVQDEDHKALYPDMLSAILKNNTRSEIRRAVVAFAAWDESGLPVKIKGALGDSTGGDYVRMVNYGDIDMLPGSTFGHTSGYSVDAACNIAECKAIAVSYETFEGETWENPYFNAWQALYSNQQLHADLKVDLPANVEVPEAQPASGGASAGSEAGSAPVLNESILLATIDVQPFRVTSAKHLVQDANHRSLHPDMLQAFLKNDTDSDVRSAVIAFAAWDEDGLPVKIRGKRDFADGGYIRQVNFANINMTPGSTFGDGYGYYVDESCGIQTLKAIVVAYETSEGVTWDNPCYENWCQLYEGKKLPS